MRTSPVGPRNIQLDLRDALGPGTQHGGVTEAILNVVVCTRRQRPRRYCGTPNRTIDRRKHRVG